jgi:uncharacterized cysteine cluster protein YcgN (CxxCxxCC family)
MLFYNIVIIQTAAGKSYKMRMKIISKCIALRKEKFLPYAQKAFHFVLGPARCAPRKNAVRNAGALFPILRPVMHATEEAIYGEYFAALPYNVTEETEPNLKNFWRSF